MASFLKPLRIATRKSPLALWQARYVAQLLSTRFPDIRTELVEVTTSGDRLLGAPLASAGGKGLFMKELEVSMLNKESDIAVHSMKDVVVKLPDEFVIAAVCERDDPLDAFVSNAYANLESLPEGARVGTCSLRRKAQIRAHFPHLELIDLRGNVNSRLAKLDSGEFDAIILAAAGLKRLGMSERIRQSIQPEISLPAVGQGAVGIECRRDDLETRERLAALNHATSSSCVEAERSMNAVLEGGCQVPIGGFAQIRNGQLNLRGLVGTTDGTRILRASGSGDAALASEVGEQVARGLIDLGAHQILREIYKTVAE